MKWNKELGGEEGHGIIKENVGSKWKLPKFIHKALRQPDQTATQWDLTFKEKFKTKSVKQTRMNKTPGSVVFNYILGWGKRV